MKKPELQRLVGYGRPRRDECIYSLEHCVSLTAEETLGEDQHHFYQLLLPDDFLNPGRRHRVVRIGLAHTPVVRTTRVDYRGSRMSFRLVPAANLTEVSRVFRKTKKEDRLDMIKEFRSPSLGAKTRDKGTVQSASYEVKQLDDAARGKQLFVVVTRIVPNWATSRVPNEPYALAVVLEDRSEQEVRYYQQLRAQLRGRGRARG